MKKLFLFAAAALMTVAFASCEEKKSSEEQTAEEAIENVVAEAQDVISSLSAEAQAKLAELGASFFGTYSATLPGNPGLKSTLTINADGTYTFAQVAENGEAVADEKGKIADLNADLVLTLTSDDAATTHLFKVVEGKLLMLNADGTEPAEDTRDAYFFTLQ